MFPNISIVCQRSKNSVICYCLWRLCRCSYWTRAYNWPICCCYGMRKPGDAFCLLFYMYLFVFLFGSFLCKLVILTIDHCYVSCWLFDLRPFLSLVFLVIKLFKHSIVNLSYNVTHQCQIFKWWEMINRASIKMTLINTSHTWVVRRVKCLVALKDSWCNGFW